MGVKERGQRTVLLGQLAARDPLHCAHLVNCIHGLPRTTAYRANCAWGWAKVDAAFGARYPALVQQTGVKLGERYPGVRVKRPIAPGEELLLESYGSSYWAQYRREQAAPRGAYVPQQLRTLTPAMKRALADVRNKQGRAKRRKM